MQPLTQGGALPKTNAQEDYAVAMKDNHGAADGNQRCAAPAGNHTICLLHDTLSTIYLQPAARDKPIKTPQKALHLSPNTKLLRLHGLPKRQKSCLQTHLHRIQPGDPTPALAIQKSYEVGGLLLPADAPHAAGHQNSCMQQRSCDVGCANNTTLLTDSADGWCAALTHAGLLPTVLQPHLCLPSHLCLPRLAAQTLLQYLT